MLKIDLVKKYLEKNRLLSLATSIKNKSWSSTVFFAYDKDLNIIFYSRDDTRHCQEIRKNKNVSLVINHTWNQGGGSINGLQITGEARKVQEKEYSKYYSIYKKRMKWADEFKKDHRLYLIKTKEIWLIDEKHFGHFHRVRVR